MLNISNNDVNNKKKDGQKLQNQQNRIINLLIWLWDIEKDIQSKLKKKKMIRNSFNQHQR